MPKHRKMNMAFFMVSIVSFAFAQKRDTLITVPLHEQVCVRGGELCIKYDSLISESRCPVGSMCMVGGEVAILLSLNGDTVTLWDVSTGTKKRQTTNYGYVVMLVTVYPYPGCHPGMSESYKSSCPSLDSSAVVSVIKLNTGAIGKRNRSAHVSPGASLDKNVNLLGRAAAHETKFTKRSKLGLYRLLYHR